MNEFRIFLTQKNLIVCKISVRNIKYSVMNQLHETLKSSFKIQHVCLFQGFSPKLAC